MAPRYAKPSAADIAAVVDDIEAGVWIDPGGEEFLFWIADIFDSNGRLVGDGVGNTPGEAMAYAWINIHDAEALERNHVRAGEVPPAVPNEGWRFELTPPGKDRIPPRTRVWRLH
jgi:hypothetical protein